MKKLIFVFGLFLLVSCTGNSVKTSVVDNDSISVDTTVVDTIDTDTVF